MTPHSVPSLDRLLTDLLAEIETGDHAAREGQLTGEQLRWLDQAKADYRRLASGQEEA
ncbi:MAG: hypothetical protein ACR2MN_07530 [Acidimicrobiales bacterium]